MFVYRVAVFGPDPILVLSETMSLCSDNTGGIRPVSSGRVSLKSYFARARGKWSGSICRVGSIWFTTLVGVLYDCFYCVVKD